MSIFISSVWKGKLSDKTGVFPLLCILTILYIPDYFGSGNMNHYVCTKSHKWLDNFWYIFIQKQIQIEYHKKIQFEYYKQIQFENIHIIDLISKPLTLDQEARSWECSPSSSWQLHLSWASKTRPATLRCQRGKLFHSNFLTTSLPGSLSMASPCRSFLWGFSWGSASSCPASWQLGPRWTAWWHWSPSSSLSSSPSSASSFIWPGENRNICTDLTVF